MITFFICLALLTGSYFTYGAYLEKLFGIDPTRKMPSETHFDGVDYVPMKKWKTFLIQLLNIAGLGPIFGAVLGATYGTVAFLWITLGGIFIGAVHDFSFGYLSVKYDGLSYPDIISRLLGEKTKLMLNLFIVFLMILVGAVFIVGPAGILNGMTGWNVHILLIVILIYYCLATMLPIDKIIGRIYPIFGAALFFMAIGILIAIFAGNYHIPELNFSNMKTNAAAFPVIPTMCITIACGAISGFHATQSPLTARCLTNQKQCKPVFFGAMITESIITLIWAAIAMAFFGGIPQLNVALAEHGNEAAWAVDLIAHSTLGKIGGLLALLGVVAAPISTGDTAFRSARLLVADFLRIGQQKIGKRLLISVPLFIAGFVISRLDFDVLWRYFAWTNQALSVVALWAATIYLIRLKKNHFVALLPAMFMTFIIFDYMFISPQMFGLPALIGGILAGLFTLLLTFYVLSNKKPSVVIRFLKKDEFPVLEKLQYEAIFIPEGMEPPPFEIIQKPEIEIYIKDFGTKKDDCCLVAEMDGKIVGGVWVRILSGEIKGFGNVDDETPEFAISLTKAYRNRGIGTKLMLEMIRYLKKKGYKQCSLAVQKANYAVKMYEKVGFEIVDENEQEYIMILKLKQK